MADGEARILVSACLLGQPVRYDGKAKTLKHQLLEKWRDAGRLVGFCPEVAAGLTTPRAPAEMQLSGGLKQQMRVLDDTGKDISQAFFRGAKLALIKAQQTGCRYALLTDGSPSCGSSWVYNEQFNGTKRPGQGVVAQLLQQQGILVFDESRIEELAAQIEDEETLA